MDIPLDQFGGHQLGLSADFDRVMSLAPLDWQGLAARLAAVHAARQVLTPPSSLGHSASGSFAPGIARDLANWRSTASDFSSPGVNLDIKADGKAPRPIGRSDAGADRSIVRGLL